MTTDQDRLAHFGFTFDLGGAHIARTMMFDELSAVLRYVGPDSTGASAYAAAIEEDNCLGKPSGKARQLTRRHLVSLYALDPEIPLFQSLLFFWQRDEAARPLLALLCACARDAVLRASAPFILNIPLGTIIARKDTEAYFGNKYPERFSPATLKSVAQNVNGSWTTSGHLQGKVKKVRTRPQVTAGSVGYALYLAYLTGERGMNLFSSEYAKLLDCGRDRAMELAEEASRRGWIVFKSVGDVIEVQFPKLLTSEVKGGIREQT